MHTLNEFKEIMKISKGNLSDFESSLGDLSMSYGETYADFMMSSTSSDIFVRIDEDENGNEILYVICDDDAPQKKKDALQEVFSCKEIIDQLTDNDIQIIKTETETTFNLLSLQEKGIQEIGKLISETVMCLWPYIIGSKTIEICQHEQTSSEEISDEENGIEDSQTEIELVTEDTESLNETSSEKPLFEELNTNRKKAYIEGNLPDRNGSTRLIHRTIGDSSYQLFFQLPDESEHFVEIICSDSKGIIDTHTVMATNQFRYLIFPYSSDTKVLVTITVDGSSAYEGVFKIPYHLRLRKNDGNIEEKRDEIVDKEQNKEENKTIYDETKSLDLNIDICLSEISSNALKLLRGGR